jgi:hypothetical protein
MIGKVKVDAPGALHHIIVREIGRARIFKNDTERNDFLTRKLEMSPAGVSQSVKSGENDADFQDFLGIIDSSGITCQSPENHQHTPHKIKCLLKLILSLTFLAWRLIILP